jgi:hypothetical protein
VVTVIFTVPEGSGGDIAIMEVEDWKVTEIAPTLPNDTSTLELNPVPVIVTEVPPLMGPDDGDMEVTDGGDP